MENMPNSSSNMIIVIELIFKKEVNLPSDTNIVTTAYAVVP